MKVQRTGDLGFRSQSDDSDLEWLLHFVHIVRSLIQAVQTFAQAAWLLVVAVLALTTVVAMLVIPFSLEGFAGGAIIVAIVFAPWLVCLWLARGQI